MANFAINSLYFSFQVMIMFRKFLKTKIKNDKLREAVEWVTALAVAVAIALLVRRFVLIDVIIFGDSMTPTFAHGDRLIINRLGYVFKEPDYNDVIVFPYKKNPQKNYVKRVIGKPGDLIEFEYNRFYINGELLDDEFSDGYIILLGNIEFPETVPENCYFVLGDNRNGSEDSRSSDVGFIHRNSIIGKPLLRFYPTDRLKLY